MILADFRRDFEIGAEEGGAELGNQFLLGVAFIAPTDAAHIAGQALFMLGPVAELMRQGGGIALGVVGPGSA